MSVRPILLFISFALAGCANVIGLEDEYYRLDDGSAGEAGAPEMPKCADHGIPPSEQWSVSASHQHMNGPPSNLIDGTSARWSTGKPQSGNEWLQVDFGKTVALRAVNLQQGGNENDYPRSYAVHVSGTKGNLNGPRVASGAGVSGVSTTISFDQVELGRYLLIQQLGSSLAWWSVTELEVSCSEQP